MTEGLCTYNVLFICAHNSARSILAEALLNRLGAGRFNSWSAGFAPVPAISPYALALLHKINYAPDALFTKPLTAVMGEKDPGFDFIIRLSPDRRGCSRTPQFKGEPVCVDWALPDPCDVVGSSATVAAAYADIFSHLAARLDTFANLSRHVLEAPTIGSRLERMGEDTFRLAA